MSVPERLFLDEVDLVVELVELFQKLALCHRRVQNVSTTARLCFIFHFTGNGANITIPLSVLKKI